MLATAEEIGTTVNPWEIDFLAQQRKIWVEKGGEIDGCHPTDKDEKRAKLSTVGDDIIKTKSPPKAALAPDPRYRKAQPVGRCKYQ